MNYGLAREIYGVTPWCVDSISFQSLSAVLKNIQNGVSLEIPEVKYNTPYVLELKGETKLIRNEWQLENTDQFEGIGVINLNGPITKGGGASSSGMIELSNSMLTMSKDSRIKGFIIATDSGGGASGAVQIMADAINEVKKSKPVYALVTKGGMAGSAAYGIISASNKIYSEDKMNIVGSVGTMIQFESKKANSEDKNGVKNIVIYASKSTMKNKAFEEAVNNDNFELIINELLDPVNENFISQTLQNRPQLEGSNFDNGHTVFSKDAIGTFIDGIASFDEVVQMVLNDSKNGVQLNTNTNFKSKTMTKEQIRNEHPEVFAAIVNEGVNSERERVNSWLVYAETDMESVTQGIESGNAISPSQREKFNFKLMSANGIKSLESDNAAPVVTAETPVVIEATESTAAENPVSNMYKEIAKKL